MELAIYSPKRRGIVSYTVELIPTGWHISHLAHNGDCDPAGRPKLFDNLRQDGIYVGDGEAIIRESMRQLWQDAKDQNLLESDIQSRLADVGAIIDRECTAHAARRREELASAEREEAGADEKFGREMRRWITEHGHDDLKAAIARGDECTISYFEDRLLAERPGWTREIGEPLHDAVDPPAAALAMMEEARRLEPAATLMQMASGRFVAYILDYLGRFGIVYRAEPSM